MEQESTLASSEHRLGIQSKDKEKAEKNMSTEPRAALRLERGAAADLWRNTLSQIPTLFGRLVYLSSLRDTNSGVYEHYGLAQVFGAKDADRTLKHSHAQAFAASLNLNLEQQTSDP